MIKQIFSNGLWPNSKHTIRRQQRPPAAAQTQPKDPSQDGDTSTTGRQNSDLSACFQIDLADTETAQQPDIVFLPGMAVVLPEGASTVAPATTEGEDNSSSARQRRERALQRRKDGISHDPMTALYQISSLLTLSTFFEYKVSISSIWEWFGNSVHACDVMSSPK